jgi:cold shock CspA family protein
VSDGAKASGTVVEFDARRGIGIVERADGARFGFHCTQIADGTRTVPVGAPVTYRIVPGPLGRWEAGEIAPRARG